MDSATVGAIADQMPLGFPIAASILGLVWTLQWRHWIRYWVRSPPPYRQAVERGFRIFFLLCFLGSAWQLIDESTKGGRSAAQFGFAAIDALLILAIVFAGDAIFRLYWRATERPL